jgi:hypothetical protein
MQNKTMSKTKIITHCMGVMNWGIWDKKSQYQRNGKHD